MENLLLDLADVILPALLGLVGAALAFATAWLKNEAGAIKDQRIRDSAMAAIDRAQAEVYASVAHVAQTYVGELKAARADGKLTPEEAIEARQRAIETFKARMGTHALEQLRAVVGDLEEWIASQIEGAVYALGKSSSAA